MRADESPEADGRSSVMTDTESPRQIEPDARALRVAWERSDERKHAVRAIWAGGPVVALAAIAAAWGLTDIALYGTAQDLADPAYGLPFILSALLALALILALASYYRSRQRVFRDKFEFEKLQNELRNQVAEAVDDELGLDTLWRLTQTRLDYYHRLATTQSALSFNSSVVAMIAGFLRLVGASIAAAVSTSTAGSIAAGAIGVIGGGLSGFIAATFLRLQEASAVQLREYFVQPVVFLQFLAAERLVRQLSADNRDEATRTIISSIVTQNEPISTARSE